MSTAWLERAFLDLASKSSAEAQEVLRNWVASRTITMGDYHALADRLTVSYLERDQGKALGLGPKRSRTGRLPALADGEGKKPKDKTGAAAESESGSSPLAHLAALRKAKSRK